MEQQRRAQEAQHVYELGYRKYGQAYASCMAARDYSVQ